MTENMKINRPAGDGEPMTKVLRDGEGFDPAAMRRPPAAPAGGDEAERKRREAEYGTDDDRGVYGEGS